MLECHFLKNVPGLLAASAERLRTPLLASLCQSATFCQRPTQDGHESQFAQTDLQHFQFRSCLIESTNLDGCRDTGRQLCCTPDRTNTLLRVIPTMTFKSDKLSGMYRGIILELFLEYLLTFLSGISSERFWHIF